MLLKQLTMLDAVSGNEAPVRDFILTKITPYADSVQVDSMGSIIAFKKGTNPSGKRVLICAHMDEVGLIVSSFTEDGYVKFRQVGGIDDRILLTQRVKIGDKKVPGVIGIKAVHLQTKEEAKKVIKSDEMYIDIGAESKKEAESMVSLGDYISFDSEFTQLSETRFKAKAIDDRAGCAILIELMQLSFQENIYFCFNVQEETGLRGATVLARKLNPEICIVLEATTASDTAFTPPHQRATTLGKGPVVSLMDRASYSDQKLNQFVTQIAQEHSIDYQYKLCANGGNDAGALQKSASGSRVCSLSLPCRYIHSPVCVADNRDFAALKNLAGVVLSNVHKWKE